MASDGTSPWVYIGIGCLALALLAIGSCVGLAWFGAKKAQEVVESMEDPEKRQERVAEVLGATDLPDGYYPVMAIGIPFVMEMAMLADAPPEVTEGEGFDIDDANRAFVYVNTRTFGDDLEELRAYLRGEEMTRDPLENVDIGVKIDRDAEVLARGEFQEGAIGYLWAATRDDTHHEGEPLVAVETLVMVECGKDSRMRLGIMMEPIPSADRATPTDELDLAGTPADEAMVREFMGHFSLCG